MPVAPKGLLLARRQADLGLPVQSQEESEEEDPTSSSESPTPLLIPLQRQPQQAFDVELQDEKRRRAEDFYELLDESFAGVEDKGCEEKNRGRQELQGLHWKGQPPSTQKRCMIAMPTRSC